MTIPKEISVSFAISDNFSQHLATVVASILANADAEDRFVFHVLARMLSDDSRQRLLKLENERSRVVFHIVDSSCFDNFPLPIEHVTQEAYYRYLVPSIIEDEDRSIFMDVDVLVYGSLKPLWEMDLGDNLIAGTPDVKEDSELFRTYKKSIGMHPDSKYFYAGMMLMDLKRLREMDFTNQCMIETGKYIEYLAWPDQDIINHLLEGRILELPLKWNCTAPKLMPRGESIVIEHFANFSAKPWCCLWKNRTWPKYLHYLLQSPYRDKAIEFIWSHIKGFFYFSYVKKGIKRVLICGILVYRKRIK